MKLVALSLAIATTLGVLLGGRLSRLSEMKLRWGPLALLGLMLQLVNPPGRWPLAMLLASFVLLTAFTIVNIRIAGFAVILAGVALNFAVIAMNGGMPVARDAVIASGQAGTLTPLTEHRGVKHHLAGPDDRLLFLGDVIAIPAPLSQVISIGDIFTYGGVTVVIAASMLRREQTPHRASVSEVPSVQV